MEKSIDYKGKKLYYQVLGQGNPVMLVHGFGEDASVWDQQVKYLQDQFLLIIPQLPGTGRSDLIDDMSMEGMADALKQIVVIELADQSPNKLVMIGHSMGGYITLAYAEKYASDLSAFGLFHSGAYADAEEKKDTRRKGIAFIKEKGAFSFLEIATPKLFSPLSIDEKPELIARQVALAHNFLPEALVSYYEGMIARPDRTQVLKESKVPVLFVLGKYDNAVPLEDGLKQSFLPGLSHIHVLKKSGHMGMLEETQKSNEIIAGFLAAIG